MHSGFVGTGIICTPMALHMCTGGHELYLRNRAGVPQGMSAAGVAGIPGNGSAKYQP